VGWGPTGPPGFHRRVTRAYEGKRNFGGAPRGPEPRATLPDRARSCRRIGRSAESTRLRPYCGVGSDRSTRVPQTCHPGLRVKTEFWRCSAGAVAPASPPDRVRRPPRSGFRRSFTHDGSAAPPLGFFAVSTQYAPPLRRSAAPPLHFTISGSAIQSPGRTTDRGGAHAVASPLNLHRFRKVS